MLTTRHLKVFISSTFQDMDEEREILLKNTFLELKKIAKSRAVEVTEIDLRTGVTKEQAESGQIVKICLDEVERCADSPLFFLGMLGNRYGSVNWLGDVSDNILEDKKYSWITNFSNRSLTEIEIISALERNKKHNRAFIYLKDGKEDNPKLTELKNWLIGKSENNKNIEVSHYRDISEFREQTIESFIKTLDELYPKNEMISEVEKLRSSHQIFAQSRQNIYIPHKENEAILSDFIDSEQDRLLLYGESGYGKSALISNYFEKFKQDNNSFVIEHYIGGAGEFSNDLYQMLRRIMLEIKEEFELPDEVPTEPQKIMDEFALWLHRVKRKTIIVFDGYNQIEDEMKEKLFLYLPDKLENVKLIITSIKDDYPINNKYKIEPLTKDEQKELVVDYLKLYGKEGIALKIQDKVTEHPQIDNTLFLRTLLNEIRLLGNFDKVEKDIANYLQAQDVVELFVKIFERLESDYRTNLVKEVLSLLYVSRDGLSEDNLMEIINQNSTEKLTRLEFSPLFFAVEEHLIDRGGLYSFFHRFILEAVEKRYLSSEELIDGERRRIVDYFEGREIDNQRMNELPYHLYALKDRDKLYQNLVEVEFFFRLIDRDEDFDYEIVKYIHFINEKYNISKDMLPNLLNSNNIYQISRIALFLSGSCSIYEEALLLYERSLNLQIGLFGEKHEKTSQSYMNLAQFYYRVNQYNKALPLYEKALKIRESFLGIKNLRTIETTNLLVQIYRELEQFDKALILQKKNIDVSIEILGKNHYETMLGFNELGVIYSSIGEYNKALNIHIESLKLNRKRHGENYELVAQAYGNISACLYYLGKFNEAEINIRKSLALYRKFFGKNHPDTLFVYTNLGKLLSDTGNYSKAIEIFKEVINLEEDLLFKDGKSSLIYPYCYLSEAYIQKEEYALSFSFLSKSLRISLHSFGKKSMITAYCYHTFGFYFQQINNRLLAKLNLKPSYSYQN
jgi:preprotein translocase subunit SecA/nephrocystin-3